MLEDWIVVTCGVVAIVVVITLTLFTLRNAERRSHESTYKLKVYTDLLNSITDSISQPEMLTRWILLKRILP